MWTKVVTWVDDHLQSLFSQTKWFESVVAWIGAFWKWWWWCTYGRLGRMGPQLLSCVHLYLHWSDMCVMSRDEKLTDTVTWLPKMTHSQDNFQITCVSTLVSLNWVIVLWPRLGCSYKLSCNCVQLLTQFQFCSATTNVISSHLTTASATANDGSQLPVQVQMMGF